MIKRYIIVLGALFLVLFSACNGEIKDFSAKECERLSVAELNIVAEIENSKNLSIYEESLDYRLYYKAEPLFKVFENEKVTGVQRDFVLLEDSNIYLTCGKWKITVSAIDKDGQIFFQGEKNVSVTRNSVKDGIVIYLKRTESCAYGMVLLCLDSSPDTTLTDLRIEFKNVETGDEIQKNIAYVYGKEEVMQLPCGTYVMNVIRTYYENDGFMYSKERTVGNTFLIFAYPNSKTIINGNINDFRAKCRVFLNLPSVLDNAEYHTYNFFTYNELKNYACVDGVSVSDYLDNKKMEDALYLVPEGEFGEPIENIGKTDSVTLYAHRKKYALNWDYAGGRIITDTDFMSNHGFYYWNSPITYPLLTRKGYVFDGFSPAFSGFMPDYDVVYKALWNPCCVTVYFDYNGADSGFSVTSKQVFYDNPYGSLPKPEKEGYSFAYWRI